MVFIAAAAAIVQATQSDVVRPAAATWIQFLTCPRKHLRYSTQL